jgi:hypothetical protein
MEFGTLESLDPTSKTVSSQLHCARLRSLISGRALPVPLMLVASRDVPSLRAAITRVAEDSAFREAVAARGKTVRDVTRWRGALASGSRARDFMTLRMTPTFASLRVLYEPLRATKIPRTVRFLGG